MEILFRRCGHRKPKEEQLVFRSFPVIRWVEALRRETGPFCAATCLVLLGRALLFWKGGFGLGGWPSCMLLLFLLLGDSALCSSCLLSNVFFFCLRAWGVGWFARPSCYAPICACIFVYISIHMHMYVYIYIFFVCACCCWLFLCCGGMIV